VAAERTWRGRVFIAMSLDGYIARSDASLDWLTHPPPNIEHDRVTSDRPALEWSAFIADIDHLVMGRGTYETVLTFDRWPFADRYVLVLSTTLSADADPRVTVARSVKEAAELLSRRGAENVYIDGGQVIQAFLVCDFVDEITIAIAPVLLGGGIALFGDLGHEVRLRLRAAHASPGGMTHATYDVVR